MNASDRKLILEAVRLMMVEKFGKCSPEFPEEIVSKWEIFGDGNLDLMIKYGELKTKLKCKEQRENYIKKVSEIQTHAFGEDQVKAFVLRILRRT